MKRIAIICWYLLAKFVLLANTSQLFAQQPRPPQKSTSQFADNPFESGELVARSPAETKRLSGQPAASFEGKLVALDQDLTFDLGNVRANSSHLIEFQLINDLGISLEFDEISASCGCIGGLPTGVKIESGKSIPIRAALNVPDSEESLAKQITLVDRKNAVIARLQVKGQSLYTCRLRQDTFTATKLGRYTFETPVEFPFDKVDFLKFRFDTPEVAGWRVIPTGVNSGTLVFDLIVSDNDGVSSTMRMQILSAERSASLGVVPVKVIRGFKPAARPSTVILRRVKDGLFGRVVVQFLGLTEPGTHKTVELTGVGKSKLEGEKPIEFQVEARLRGGKDLLTLAELTVHDERVMQRPNDFDLSVSFIVGNEVLRVPMTIFDEEE